MSLQPDSTQTFPDSSMVERAAVNQAIASKSRAIPESRATSLEGKPGTTKADLLFQKQHPQLSKVLEEFIDSRKIGTSVNTLKDYRKHLRQTLPVVGLYPTVKSLMQHMKDLSNKGHNQGGVDNFYKNFSAFYNWYYSIASGYTTPEEWLRNPIPHTPRPGRSKLLLHWHTVDDVNKLIQSVPAYEYQARDRAIIAMFPESGLRLEEMSLLKFNDIDFKNRRIRVRKGKGNKPRYAPFGNLTAKYLKEYLATVPLLKYDDYLWIAKGQNHLDKDGIDSMLDRMRRITGIHCNAHSFRRTFAIWLRLEGVDTLMIRDLGGWESVAMVERYTRSLEKEQAHKFYRSPYGNSLNEFKSTIFTPFELGNLKIDFGKLPKDLLSQLFQYVSTN